MVLKVKQSTPIMCMRAELRRPPVPLACILVGARFWNKLANLEDGHLVAKCWRENLELGEGSWTHSMASLKSKVFGSQDANADAPWDLKLCEEQAQAACAAQLESAMQPCMQATFQPEMLGDRVQGCPQEVRDGYKAFKYALWFQQPASQTPVLWHLPEPGNIRILAQFRLSAHHLAVEAGREGGLRDTRVCCFCQDRPVEDECHVLLCSAWQVHRDRFPAFFQSPAYRKLVTAVRDGFEVDCCFKEVVNPPNSALTDCLAGYLKLVNKSRLERAVAP